MHGWRRSKFEAPVNFFFFFFVAKCVLNGIQTKTERKKDRKTERQKERKTERQKDRKTERKTERHHHAFSKQHMPADTFATVIFALVHQMPLHSASFSIKSGMTVVYKQSKSKLVPLQLKPAVILLDGCDRDIFSLLLLSYQWTIPGGLSQAPRQYLIFIS